MVVMNGDTRSRYCLVFMFISFSCVRNIAFRIGSMFFNFRDRGTSVLLIKSFASDAIFLNWFCLTYIALSVTSCTFSALTTSGSTFVGFALACAFAFLNVEVFLNLRSCLAPIPLPKSKARTNGLNPAFIASLSSS